METEVIVYLYSDSASTSGEMTWSLLLNGTTSFTIYLHNSGIWFMNYEGLEQPISRDYAISLIKQWRNNKYSFLSIPTGFYQKLIKKEQ